MTASPKPRRGEIWTADLGNPPVRHWVVVVSLDGRNLSELNSVLVVPFGSRGAAGPTTLEFPPGETGLPGVSYLKAHFVQVLEKARLLDRLPRPLSSRRMRQVVNSIRRAVDPDAPWPDPPERGL